MGIFDKLKKKKPEEKREVSKKEAVVDVTLKQEKTVKKTKKDEDTAVAAETKSPPKADQPLVGKVAKTGFGSQANSVLFKTLVSEKAAIAEGRGVYTFVVNNKTNKLEVKKAVKEIYGIMPEKVRMVNVEGRQTRFGYRLGRQSDWKKAIVTLPKGKTINIHEGV